MSAAALQFPGGSVALSSLTSTTPERSTVTTQPAPAFVTENDVEELDLVRTDGEPDPGLDGPYTIYGLLAGNVVLGVVTHYEPHPSYRPTTHRALVELSVACDRWAIAAIVRHVRAELCSDYAGPVHVEVRS